MNERPKPGEDEDDLLKFQQQFLSQAGSSGLSVSVKRPEKRKTTTQIDTESKHVVEMEGIESEAPLPQASVPVKKSKFKSVQNDRTCISGKKLQAMNVEAQSMSYDEDMDDIIDRKDTGFAAVLSTIIERDTHNAAFTAPKLNKTAFPSVISLEGIEKTGKKFETQGKVKKKSLFAQQVEKQGVKKFGIDHIRPLMSGYKCPMATESSKNTLTKEPSSSCIVDGKGLSISDGDNESQRIHQENIEKLGSMLEADILEEQQKLFNTLDPKLLEYLKTKRDTKVSDEKPAKSQPKQVSFSVQREIKKKQKTDKENPSKDKLPIIPSKKWLHMGKVEKDKMEWMKDLPVPSSTSSQTGRPARFDFKGNIMAVDADVPVNIGLHHHGDEPERAGYSLEELFQLARSSNLQQRCLSLHTLARIIMKAKSGGYVNKIETPILPAILSGGVLILLRWGLDDSTESCVAAALDALHSLLCQPQDEEAIDRTWSWYMGHTRPSLIPTATLEKNNEPEELDEENIETETDADVSKRDVILALVTHMDLLIRLRYVLSSMKPQAMTVVHILSILTRVVQHSLNLAYEVVKCPGLLDMISQEFIPTAWEQKDCTGPVSNVYGLPVPAALRLFSSLCQAGRNIASSLVSKYTIHMRILRYLAVPYSELQLPVQEAANLQIEALVLWRVTSAYGLTTETFFDLYSNILPDIGKLQQRWQLACAAQSKRTQDGSVSEVQTRLDVGLICVLEQMLNIVNSTRQLQQSDPNAVEQMSLPSISLSEMTGFLQPVRSCVESMLTDIGSQYTAKKHNLNLPTACLNFMATFYDVEGKQGGLDEVTNLEQLELLTKSCLVPFLSSYGFTTIVENLCPCSNILHTEVTPISETSPSLPNLSVISVVNIGVETITDQECDQKNTVPIVERNSPFGFLVSVLRLVLSVCKRHKGLINQLIPPLVQHMDIKTYLKKVCSMTKVSQLSNCHFTRMENILQYLWLKCCVFLPDLQSSIPHKLSLRLLSRIQDGDEFLAHDLMSSVIFSQKFFSEGEDLQSATQALASLSLSETFYLKSATLEEISISKSQLLQGGLSALATVRGHYLMAFGGLEKAVQESRNVFCGNCHKIQSLMSKSMGETLMPRDWTYMPLIHVYNQTINTKSLSGASMSPQAVSMVTSVLQWNLLLEEWRPAEIENVSVTIRLSRIMCAFLAGSDLFLEKPIHNYLAGLLRIFTTQRHIDQMDFEEKIPGITSFYDLYQEFLEQYEAVSFGDPVFGLYLILPLQQRHSPVLRKAVWGERRKLLRTLRIPLNEMLIPIENFMTADEKDLELVQLYNSALLVKAVQPTWSPVMYLLAVHHVNHFLFLSEDDGNKMIRSHMWSKVLANENKMTEVIFYKQANLSSSNGMIFYDTLPPSRQTTYNYHKSSCEEAMK